MNASTLTAFAAVGLAIALLTVRRARKPLPPKISSPRDTLLPQISSKQAAALPYPPGLFPGARDVTTPYGVMRVYEWGPKDGDKVLFIHGDTTPAPMLGPIAHNLSSRGCRVMMFGMSTSLASMYSETLAVTGRLMSVYIMLTIPGIKDLWGRGYSDTPLGTPHDSRLFGLQIFFAAASSSVSWIGEESGGFSIVAFSLGGGIAIAFAADFYHLVNSIVLLAPVGIIRRLPAEYETVFFRYPFLLPSSYLRRLVSTTLGLKVLKSTTGYSAPRDQSHMAYEIAREAKTVEKKALDIPGIVRWQFDNHRGFVHSFVNTIQYGPIQYQHSDWRRVCSIVKGDNAGTPPSSHQSKLFDSKILVVFGDADSIVLAEEVSADLLEMIGDPEHVEVKVVAGNHGFPVPSCDEVAKHISDFCGFGSRNGSPT